MKRIADFLWHALSSWVSAHELNSSPDIPEAADELFQRPGRKFLPVGCGTLFMAHHTGFTLRTLVETVRAAGFRSVAGIRRDAYFDLWIVAAKEHLSEQEMQVLMDIHPPQ